MEFKTICRFLQYKYNARTFWKKVEFVLLNKAYLTKTSLFIIT